MIGEAAATEAIVTGLGAAVLSYALGTMVIKIGQWRGKTATASRSEADLDQEIVVEKQGGEPAVSP